MNRALIEGRLALAEGNLALAKRQVANSRERILRQNVIIAHLVSSGRARTLTAKMAWDLLQSLHTELAMHIADGDRLRQWIVDEWGGHHRLTHHHQAPAKV
jgi:hypothetical protein